MNFRQMLLTPKQFLLIGGIVLIVVGVVGFFGVIGPSSDESIFGTAWWFDNAENWAHLVLGVVGVAASFVLKGMIRRYLVMALGVVGILVAVYNIFSTKLLAANLESPADLILHLVVGGWALAASIPKEPAEMPAMGG